MKRILLSLFSLLAVAFASQAAFTIESVETVSPSETTGLQSAKVFELTIVGEFLDNSEYWGMLYFGSEAVPYVTNGTNSFKGSFYKDNNVMGKLTLTLDEEVTTPGTYKLVIPENALKLGFSTYAPFEKKDFFTIGEIETPNILEKAEWTPESGSVVTEISKITVIFPDVTNELVEAFDDPITIEETVSGTKYMAFAYQDNYTSGYIEVMGAPITADGDYVIKVPEGAWYIGDMKSPAYELHYTIGEIETPNFFTNAVWTPEEGSVTEINRIDVEFPDSNNAWVEAFDDSITIEETVSGIEYIAYAYEDNYTSGYIQVMGAPITADGDYVVKVPEGAWFSGDMKSPAYELHYTIGAIVGAYVIINDAENNVFDIAGRVVLRGADAASVKSLEPGIYVVNGKKVVIRK